jgi:hypothetical protein
MTLPKPYEIALRLEDIRDLFHEPDFDPLQGKYNRYSGLDQLLNELKPLSLRRPLRTTIFLPQVKMEENSVEIASEAVRVYCELQIRQIENEMASLRWKGIKALQTGLLFLAVCLLLSIFLGALEVLPEFFRTFLSEGFLIAGWVSLWHPIEILLYEWWPFWRDKQLYMRIQDMEVIIAPEAQGG